MKIIFIKYRLALISLMVSFFFHGKAQFDYPVRREVSFGGKLVDMQKRFTAYINNTNDSILIKARRLSLEGMRLKDKMDNRAAIICYLKAELLLSKSPVQSELTNLVLADVLQNKGRAYHYIVKPAASLDFINESKRLNESLISSKNIEIARFAYFFLATNYDMLEGIMPIFRQSGTPYAYAAVKIKRDMLNIRGAEMGRSYWNYAGQFCRKPASKEIAFDTMIVYAQLADKEFKEDKNIDRIYTAEFTSSNNMILAERYKSFYNNADSCKFYTEKIIAALSGNETYKFPDKLPVFINQEEVMRSSRSLSEFLTYIYQNTNDKRYLEVARDFLDSAVKALSNHTAETFVQGERNIGEMKYTNRFLIRTLATGESFPVKNEKGLDFLAQIEKAKTFNYKKKLLENQIVHSSQTNGLEIQLIRKLNSMYDNLEESRLKINHSEYLIQNLSLLTQIDSLEKLNYKKEILNSVFLSDENPEIGKISSSLKPATTILLYYLDEFANLCASISSAGVEIYQIPVENDFYSDLGLFQELNTRQTMLDENWCRLSNKIYKSLVQSYVKNMATNELIIISSGILNRIPFESLVTSWSKNSEGKFAVKYLMQDMNIRYEYSLKPFYKSETGKQMAGKEKVYAFAPKYAVPSATTRGMTILPGRNYMESNLRSESFPLKFNVPEAEMVASSQNGVAFVNDDATEEKFREVAGNADILHLSMHSYAFNEDPMYWGLVFAENKNGTGSGKTNLDITSWFDDGILYAYEIYQMNLKSDMVVLSACETGIGRYETGEGTRSLGLAFRYAGCNNTVMSLWAVDDEYTQELMRSFYNYLKQGKPKAEALKLAKNDFVKNNKTAGPFFWAGFILYGDNQPVNLKKHSGFAIFLVVGLIATLLVGLGYFHRKARK